MNEQLVLQAHLRCLTNDRLIELVRELNIYPRPEANKDGYVHALHGRVRLQHLTDSMDKPTSGKRDLLVRRLGYQSDNDDKAPEPKKKRQADERPREGKRQCAVRFVCSSFSLTRCCRLLKRLFRDC